MKYLIMFENFIYSMTPDELKNKVVEHTGGTMYHHTYRKNIESILSEGLIPRKNKNFNYESDPTGHYSNAVFLTMDPEFENFRNNIGETDSDIICLEVGISNLDYSLFVADDDALNWDIIGIEFERRYKELGTLPSKVKQNNFKKKLHKEYAYTLNAVYDSLLHKGDIGYKGIIDPKYIKIK